MKRFEYCYIYEVKGGSIETVTGTLHFSNGQVIDIRTKQLDNVLDGLGRDGWEMVGCGCNDNGERHNIYFKREI